MMAGSECSENKISSFSYNKGKPFIDQNLQFQLPSRETSPRSTDRPLNPIYSHYMGSHPSIAYLIPQINEEELYQAMNQAEYAYQAWKRMRGKIHEKINK